MLRLFALAAALTVPLVAGCGATSVTHLGSQPHRDHRVIAIVGDASCDATAAQRAQTLGIVELAAGQAAAQRGTLLFDRLGRNALAAMTFPVQHEFVPSDDVPEGNSALEAEDLQRQQAQVRKAARRLLLRPTRRCGTDLAGGFVAIARALQRHPSQPRSVIVVSNMLLVDREERLDFVHDRLTRPYIARALKRLDRRGLVPDLRGVRVTLVGGGVDPSERISQARGIAIERFWRAYVAAAHATLETWQPRLVSVEPPATTESHA